MTAGRGTLHTAPGCKGVSSGHTQLVECLLQKGDMSTCDKRVGSLPRQDLSHSSAAMPAPTTMTGQRPYSPQQVLLTLTGTLNTIF